MNDFETVRESLGNDGWRDYEATAALDRIEAEVERLQGDLEMADEAIRKADPNFKALQAEVERLRAALDGACKILMAKGIYYEPGMSVLEEKSFVVKPIESGPLMGKQS